MSHGNLNFRQATSKELLKVSIFCADILFELFSLSINSIIQRGLGIQRSMNVDSCMGDG